jgi:hypothetical protein
VFRQCQEIFRIDFGGSILRQAHVFPVGCAKIWPFNVKTYENLGIVKQLTLRCRPWSDAPHAPWLRGVGW